MGHRLQQFLPFGRIIDLGEFLRQIRRTRIRSRVWGSKKISVGLTYLCWANPMYNLFEQLGLKPK